MNKYHDFLPDNNLEKKYFGEIASQLASDIKIVAKNFGDPMPEVSGEKIIFMNADEQYRIPEEVNDPSVKLIFKQYCKEEQHEKLKPLPLGPSKDFKYIANSFNDRIYDVTFIGQVAHNRVGFFSEMYKFLSDHTINSFFGLYQGFNKGLDMDSYSKVLSNTKVAICPHGTASPESFRFFEAMSANCVVVCAQQPDNWIYRNAPYIALDSGVNTDRSYDIVKALLSDPVKLKLLSDKSKEYYDNNLTASPVAQYINNELRSI